MSEQNTVRPTQLPVVQPDPMLREVRAGRLRLAATALGAGAIVILVLYGLSRPEEQPQMAGNTAEAADTAPVGGGAANNAGGQAQPANVPAQNAEPNPQQPATTGQGSGQDQGRAGQGSGPPAAGGAATGTVAGPGAKPAPQAR